ncbi:MAG: AMP-binding protein, partial [Chloroflexi bacterium]|nr:AMP-binding protein [Chloroflexota bacterium]
MTDPAATMVVDPIATGADDALALVTTSDRRTWAELRREAMAVAAGLARHGVTSGARVGVLATPGASVAAIHAIRVAGGVLVPLDARLGEPELRDRIQRAGRTLLLHDAPHADVASSLATSRTGITSLDLATAGVSEGAAELPPLDTAALAALVPTSGTTTRARLVRLDHAALLASADAWNGWLGATSADPWLAAMPLTHVAGLGMVLRAARTGACLHVHDRFDVERIGETLATAGIRFLSVVPTQLRRVLDAGVMPGPTLRALLLGGAPIPHDLVTRALDAGWPVVATYGLTEAASAVTALPVAEARDGAGSSGRPLPAMQVRIVAPDGSQAPTSTDGAIEVSGPSVMAGYEDDPVATSAALHDGWLRTGDIGRLDVEGRLWVLDRRDDLIVSGGENVSPAAVEAVIADHEGVDDAGVVGWPDPRWGARPAAAVVLASDAPVGTLATIGDHVRHRLGPWHAPAWVAQVSAI